MKRLSDRDLAFCDFSDALEQGFREDLPRDIEVRTSSPGLLKLPAYRTVPLEQDGRRWDTFQLGREITVLGQVMHDAFAKDQVLATFGRLAAQTTLNFQRVVYKAQFLRSDDLHRRIVHLGVDTKSPHSDLVFNGFWKDLLADHPDALIRRYPFSSAADATSVRHYGTFVDRWRLTGLPRIGYRLALASWRWMPNRLAQGTVLVLRENPLVRETAFWMALRGYAVTEITTPRTAARSPDGDTTSAIDRLGRPLLESFLTGRVVDWARTALIRHFVSRLATDVTTYLDAKSHWHLALRHHSNTPRRVVLSSMFNTPETLALFDACTESGIELVSAQHGVTMEITDIGDQEYWIESATSHVFLAYNKEAVFRSRSTGASRAESVAVGMPLDYHRAKNGRPSKGKEAPILYASTSLYMGNIQQPSRPCINDHEKAAFEIAFVNEVLGKLPHKVRYKTYPETRYLDPDPILEAMRRHANIDVFEQALDLRFMLAQHRIVVTARATSTLGWCLMSEKPVVFIDIPGGQALDAPARGLLEKAIFLFPAEEEGWHERLRDFLAQPIEAIEAEYRERRADRNIACEAIFSSGGPGAGRRAASYLDWRLKRSD